MLTNFCAIHCGVQPFSEYCIMEYSLPALCYILMMMSRQQSMCKPWRHTAGVALRHWTVISFKPQLL